MVRGTFSPTGQGATNGMYLDGLGLEDLLGVQSHDAVFLNGFLSLSWG